MNGLLEMMAVICREQMEEFAILQQKIEHARQMQEELDRQRREEHESFSDFDRIQFDNQRVLRQGRIF